MDSLVPLQSGSVQVASGSRRKERRVRIQPEFLQSVVFICDDAQLRDSKSTYRRVIGTGFCIRILLDGFQFIYFVTARHVVEGPDTEILYVRVRTEDGGMVDIETAPRDWYTHDNADVAAIPMNIPESKRVHGVALGVEIFIDADYVYRIPTSYPERVTGILNGRGIANPEISVSVGDEVSFVSLFSQRPGQNTLLPVARFGRVSAMPTEPIRMTTFGGLSEFQGLAYLVESHSWGGHSGAPAFWYVPILRKWSANDGSGEAYQQDYIPALLGLVSGHFPIGGRVTTQLTSPDESKEQQRIRTELNSGIAIVTPASEIKNLLMRDDLVKERVDIVASKSPEVPPAVLDRAVADDAAFTRNDFL